VLDGEFSMRVFVHAVSLPCYYNINVVHHVILQHTVDLQLN